MDASTPSTAPLRAMLAVSQTLLPLPEACFVSQQLRHMCDASVWSVCGCARVRCGMINHLMGAGTQLFLGAARIWQKGRERGAVFTAVVWQ